MRARTRGVTGRETSGEARPVDKSAGVDSAAWVSNILNIYGEKFEMRILAVAGVLLIAVPSTVLAAPAQLLNKTAQVSYTISIPAKKEDGSTLVATRATSRTIYISSQGRVFVRVASRARGGSADREIGPEKGGGGSLHFQGDRLVGVLPAAAGAIQLTVTFDPSGSSCDASLIVGTESSRPYTWKGLNGSMMTATAKPGISGISCSVSAGNGLAG
jgi:hypothetical protein